MALTTTTIPAGWSPGSSCQNSSDNWIWFDSGWGMAALGPPDQSSSCYPPDFTPTLGQLYGANACPDGFTPACTTNYYSSSWSTLCCPQATNDISYACNYRSFWSWTAACVTSMSCYSTYMTLTYTSFGNSVPSTDATFTATGPMLYGGLTTSTTLTSTGIFSYVTTYDPKHSFWAFGIAISPPASTSDTSDSSSFPSTTGSNSSPTPSTSTSSTSGLSAGASAGIAIGALIAAILIALGGWLLYRRGVKKPRGGDSGTGSAGQKSSPEEGQQSRTPMQWRSSEYIPQRSPVEVHETDFRRYELYEHAQRSPVEVHADNDFRRYELHGNHRYPELS